MASRTSLAIAQADAIKRINEGLTALAKEKGREIAPIPSTGRDAAVLSKNQLVSIADALEILVERSKAKAKDADKQAVDTPDATDETSGAQMDATMKRTQDKTPTASKSAKGKE